MSLIRCAIPTLNSAGTLEQAIVSLRSQVGGEVEIVVVDSGSTDGTLEICRRHNIQTLFEEPGNIYRAINRGLQGSETEWLAYLNSDDWLYPDALRRLIDHGSDSDVVYGNCDYADEGGRFLFSFRAASPCCLMALFRTGRMGFAQPASIFRNRVFRQLEGFDTRYRFKADADFVIRALNHDYKFARLTGRPTACFRIHRSQLSNARKDEIDAEGGMLFGGMMPGLSDRIRLLKWRMTNIPHYALRILRDSLLSGRISINRSVDRHSL
ncbi:MAG: glycosyltransferase [Acidobacteriota bacterium]|nr:MAG: glycosyltransferase [Acidobacteriota bacterium]